MTQEYDPAYLDNLVIVAADDVAVIREKEKTYQGSWKKREGIGAFMMLVRHFDRLENMLSSRTPAERGGYGYDVFAAIAADASGRDGTALACVRDTRRYLMLVEAEMMHRGVVRPEMLPDLPPAPPMTSGLLTVPLEQMRLRPTPDRVESGWWVTDLASTWGCTIEQVYERVYKIAGTRHSPLRVLQGKWGKDEAGVLDELKKSRREDSNRHALQQTAELQDHGEIVKKTPPDPRQFNFSDRLQDGLPREEYVKTGTPYVYDVVSDSALAGPADALVDRGAVQNDCSHLPRLPLEQNQKEWEEQPRYYRWLYYWTGEKYVLRDTYRQHWGQQ